MRTAVFNWLWAKKNHGEFILRIEDTDKQRTVAGAQEQLIADLQAIGLDWDYGPTKPSKQFGACVQSQRLPIYQDMIKTLLDSGVAYYDCTTNERLAELRQQAQVEKRAFLFRRSMATPGTDNQRASIRISVPDDLALTWQDTVRGEQTWQSRDVGDFVAIKSDGYPTYHFASVVDDHLMGISHVIRGDEWLSSTPKHIYLLDQLGFSRPAYSHVSPILGSDNKKLSKREGAQGIGDYVKSGYMSQALINFLALLGWNPGTEKEVFTLQELIEAFSLDKLQSSGAQFDPVRLDWMNGQHIRMLTNKERQQVATNWWGKASSEFDAVYKNQVLELVFERLKRWGDLEKITSFFFADPEQADKKSLQTMTGLSANAVDALLTGSQAILGDIEFSTEELETHLYRMVEEHKVKAGEYFMLLRLILTGSKVAPGLMETMNVLGKEVCLRRLTKLSAT